MLFVCKFVLDTSNRAWILLLFFLFFFCGKYSWICQRYCNALKELGLLITELLAISLGVDRFHYRNFFEDCVSMMRCNYYPPCQNPGLTFGTGPHCDPNSLTILHQDQVGGLEVFSNNKWKAIRPEPGALVVNIGDTFMVGPFQ